MKKKTKTEILRDFLLTLPKEGYPPCNRRNGRPADGWTHGYPLITRAIKGTGLPYDNYWSGSNPTPATQYPIEIVDAARAAGFID